MANKTINSLAFGSDTHIFSTPYGTCSTAAGTAAKTVTISNFALESGAKITVKFTNNNSVASPTLNVNSTGAKAIYWRGAALPAKQYWTAGAVLDFVYNGTQWDVVGVADISTLEGLVGTTSVATQISNAVENKSDTGHKHTKSDITDFPTSMPASDVSAWAKASTKPTYTYSEVGAAAASHNHSATEITSGTLASDRLPTAGSTLGGVKTTSTVTSTSGLTACPIISGVPYYKDTDTNTDTKVNTTLATTTKAYLLGTSTTPTSTAQAVTTVADTGVYLDTTAGQLVATKFKGALDGNATSATKATQDGSGNTITSTYATKAALDTVSGLVGTTSVSTQISNAVGAIKYAGASTAGGSATSAVKLDTATAGSATQPVYFTGGKPEACTYSLGASVPSGAKFTDTVTTASTSGSGNAVTAVTASNGALTVTKGDTFVNLSSAQTVSGVKTFSNGIKIGNATLSYSSTDEALVITI